MVKRFLSLFLISGLLFLAASPVLAQQSLVKIGKDVLVPANVEVDKAVSIGGDVTVIGKVKGDAVAIGGSLFLRGGSSVGGNAVSVGGTIVKAPTAVVRGDITEVAIPIMGGAAAAGLFGGFALFSLLSFIGFVVLAAILVALFTPQLKLVSTTIEKNIVKTILWGLLITVLFVPIMILLAISIVGIVLIPVWVILVSAAGLFGYIAAAQFIGKKILAAFKLKKVTFIVETLAGILLLALVSLVPILGGLIKAIVCLGGLGAVTLSRFGTQKA